MRFLVNSMEISKPGKESSRPLRPGPKMVQFQNGDRAYYDNGKIMHWKKLLGKAAKYEKTKVGTADGLEFTVNDSKKIVISLRQETSAKDSWAVKVSDHEGRELGSGKITAFCGKSGQKGAEQEARRLIGYYLWRVLMDDLERTIF